MKRSGVPSISVGFVGTYPPAKCGIATFTASLAKAMAAAGTGQRVGVVASVERPGESTFPPGVVAELVRGSEASSLAAAAALDRFDVVVIQHEFGIFGGPDGSEIIDLVERLHVPVIVVLHTVPRAPTPGQRAVVERLVHLAAHTVAQSRAARTRLLEMHIIDPLKVSVIPHGAPANLVAEQPPSDPARPQVVLTWGLIGPSKGLEFGIEAIALLRDLQPPPLYVIAGQTHPRILEERGEEYRDSLVARAAALGVDQLVSFNDDYRDLGSTMAQIRDADIVLLPYLSREQVVSGVLVEAIASGKPVVSTRFPHAEELLGEGSGILVPHEDSVAIAAALRALLTDPVRSAATAAVAQRQAPMHFWNVVGESYLRLASALIAGATPDLVRALQPARRAQAAARNAVVISAPTTVAAPTQLSAAP
jgi:glycosyltransferase involved in cell wall biosynthesis